MPTHWHTSVVTGVARPVDASPASPLVVREWVFRPRGVYVATFAEPEEALSWLRFTLDDVAPPMPGDLNAAERAGLAREGLVRHPEAGAEPAYSARGYLVQDLIGCRAEHGALLTDSSCAREQRFAPRG